MLEHHKKTGASCTVATITVPIEEASRFGICNTNPDNSIYEFEEKPKNPKNNQASMGIYIFNAKILIDYLEADEADEKSSNDFGKNIIPNLLNNGEKLFAYKFNGYWKDVGTLSSYWEANMELIDIVPEFNLYEEYWKIYTKSEIQPPQYIAADSVVERSVIGEGTEIYGEVYNSVIGCGVTIGKGTVVRDSIIMNQTQIGDNCELTKAIIAENAAIGNNVKLGVGEEAENDTAPHIYNSGLVTIGEHTVIPDGISIGKNSVVFGITAAEDYENACLPSGRTLIKAGDE
jgi:glucose-1-phosphate adenylyltransferase